jgi:hypothetical protein
MLLRLRLIYFFIEVAEDYIGDVDLDIYECVYPSESNKDYKMPFELNAYL